MEFIGHFILCHAAGSAYILSDGTSLYICHYLWNSCLAIILQVLGNTIVTNSSVQFSTEIN